MITNIKLFASILVGMACLSTSYGQFKSQSVLREEGFHKISVPNAGIYRIDAEFVRSFTADANPNRLAIYGTQGGQVPQGSEIDRIDDLEQLPLLFVGNGDSNWSDDEYFIFYAEGDESWTMDGSNSFMEMNPYTQVKHYYITVDEAAPLRISDRPEGGEPVETVTTYDDFQHYEEDVVNLLGENFGTQGSGLRWYGSSFGLERSLDMSEFFDYADIVEGSEMVLRADLAVRSDRTSSVRLSLNESSSERSMNTVRLLSSTSIYARRTQLSTSSTYVSGSRPALTLAGSANSSNYDIWLDYAILHTQKRLTYDGRPLAFTALREEDRTLRYQIAGATDLTVWGIPSAHDAHRLPTAAISGAVTIVGSSNQPYIAFRPADIDQRPTYVEAVAPQNLHAMETASYVIVYHPDFEEQAERLAAHRRSHDGMSVVAVDVNSIYNEFGGGSPDPTAIRDFARMLFSRGEGFAYLCLFGDATYDYRGLDPSIPYDNFVPCYQTKSELHPIDGFPSDDYFALLNNGEGANLQGGVDIATGRIPVSTSAEARIAVDKIISYDTDTDFFGEWKNDMIFVADDEDNNTHLSQNERVSRLVDDFYPVTIPKKVYFDAFDQQSTTGDDRYPDAEDALNGAINQGALMVNYFGHGGPNGWSQERVLDIQDILSWTNRKRLPLFVTATCTFTGYDDAGDESGGELTFLNPSGGAIGLVSTVRAVFISGNERLVNSFLSFVYETDEDGPLRLGEVMRRAKNNHSTDTLTTNARKFALIGDPAMQLAFPEYNVALTKINDIDADIFSDTLGALQEVRLQGQIEDGDHELVSQFNGLLNVRLFDKAQVLTTRANDGSSIVQDFEQLSTVLYSGSANVENGRFELSFRIPRDINYEVGLGRLSMYASDRSSTDATGVEDGIYIGGTYEDAIIDDNPPQIGLFMNTRSFSSGDRVGPSPTMIVDLVDDFGINLSNASIGHQITAVIDGDAENQIILNPFYTAIPGESASGIINYNLSNLAPGEHTLTLQAYDISNNRARATIRFIVDDNRRMVLSNLQVAPNPLTTAQNLTLTFDHELPAGRYELRFEAYDLYGRPVMRIEEDVDTDANGRISAVLRPLSYTNVPLSAGMYVFNVSLHPTSAAGQGASASYEGGKFLIME